MLGKDGDLIEAIRFYLHSRTDTLTPITIKEAFEDFLCDKQAANLRPLTLQNLRSRVGALVKRMPDRHLSTISAQDITRILFKPGLKPTSIDNQRRALSSFFSWAEKRGYCKVSPMRAVEKIRTEREEPAILIAAQITQFLQAAQSLKAGLLLPYVTLSLFAGIRPSEMKGLSWDAINLNESLITISSKTAKMRQRRLIQISDNLVEWLRPYARIHAPIVPRNFRRDFDTLKAMAGFAYTESRVNMSEADSFLKTATRNANREAPDWIPDIIRHTAISYHLATHEHEGQTASWAGNSPDIVQRHYKGLVSQKQVKWYWGLRPSALSAAVA
ncbi:MAG: site-specific integrase [Opitutales bacterium]|nr:site-specific integrase [Opitutales bacterium]NRA28361.1 tyrosine-type recombinase/integrase [Opitutales bacterium]